MTAYAIQRYRKSCFSCLYWDNDSCMFSSCIFIIITCIHFFCIPTKLINHCGLKLWVHKTNIFFILIYSYSKKWNRQSTVSLCAKLLIFLTVQQARHSHLKWIQLWPDGESCYPQKLHCHCFARGNRDGLI